MRVITLVFAFLFLLITGGSAFANASESARTPDIAQMSVLFLLAIVMSVVTHRTLQRWDSENRREQRIGESRRQARLQIHRDLDERGKLSEDARDLDKLQSEFLKLFAGATRRYLTHTLGRTVNETMCHVKGKTVVINLTVSSVARESVENAIRMIVNQGANPQIPAVAHGDAFSAPEVSVIVNRKRGTRITAVFQYTGARRYCAFAPERRRSAVATFVPATAAA